MSKQNNSKELIPSARRIITSLRDLGYDFSAAIADIVDNSIAAKARNVRIDIEFDGDASWVRILDDGKGMDRSTLLEAMRYGSEKQYGDDDLGKFGLGLKTASLSQCQCLTVASKRKGGHIICYRWDLNHIQTTNKWTVLELRRKQIPQQISGLLKNAGTCVLWERLDRILGYRHPYGEFSRKRLLELCRETESHLAMVFHRFLDGTVGKEKRLSIVLNSNQFRGWDPYVRKEKNTTSFSPKKFWLKNDFSSGEIAMQGFVLPHQNKFSNALAHALAAGPKRWNRQQGFYIYRANRMIQSGGWSGLRTLDEHDKLARISLSFNPNLDEAFKINVAKMRVQLPQEIRSEIEKEVSQIVNAANKAYREGGRGIKPQDRSSRNGSSSTRNQGQYKEIERFCNELFELCNKDEKKVLLTLFERLSKSIGYGIKIRK